MFQLQPLLKSALFAAPVIAAGLCLAMPAKSQNPVFAGSTTAQAGVADTVNIVLNDTTGQYVVPDGKVLVVEHLVWALESDHTHQRVSIKPYNDPTGTGDFQLKFSTTAPDMHSFDRPLRIKGDGFSGISIYKNSQVDWRDVCIFGFLRDA